MKDINYQKFTENITNWLQQSVHESGFKKVIIGLSGGVDSAVSVSLAVKALGKENVMVVLMPYGQHNQKGLQDSKLIVKELKILDENIFIIDIKKAVDDFCENDLSNIRKGNIMARVRMIYLYDLSKKYQALVCGTENKTEYYLGYFTRFGDEASDIEPIRNLYKTQVWELAKYLGVPEIVINNFPTAGLWEGQTDEGEFGFSYKDADQVLYLHFEKHLSLVEIIKTGINKETVEKVLNWVSKMSFKHNLPKIY